MSSFFQSFSFSRVRVVSLTLTLQCILAATVYSQPERATLGIVTEIRAAKNPRGLVTGDFDGNGLADLASYNTKHVLLQTQGTDSLLWRSSDISFDEGSITRILAAYCNSDKLSDLIVVDGKASTIRIYLAKYGLQFYYHSSIRFKDEPPELLVTDINNDGKTDLLMYGKRESGIAVYPGNGGGGFAKSTVLFPQKSFSNVTITDLNNDKYNDIIAVDWLDNELNISRAFGKMKFSEPVIIHYETEPQLSAAARLDDDNLKDIVLSFTGNGDFQTLYNDTTGKFDVATMFNYRSLIDKIVLADMDVDGKNDIVLYSQELQGIAIWLNDNDRRFLPPVEFSGGQYPCDVTFFYHGKTNNTDVAFVDSVHSVVRILYNSKDSIVAEKEVAYALGMEPNIVLSFDMIGNNLIDLAALDKQSKAICLFLNRGDGTLSGLFPIPVPISGTNMQYALKNGNESYFLVINPHDEQVSVTEFNSQTFKNSSYSIPVQRNSQLLVRYVEKNTGMLNFFLLANAGDEKQTTINKFSQIAPTRFVEQTVISRFEPPLYGVTMGDFDKDNDYDIAFLGKNAGRGMFELRTILREETTKAVQPRLDFVMNMKDFPQCLMWNADLTGDGYPDLIINFLSPLNQMLISISGNQQKFEQPKFRFRIPINVSSRSQLKIVDVNGDNKMDIVLNNSLTNEIQAFWGTGNGTFPIVNRLISSEGIGGFTFADLDNDNLQELIVTDSLNGWMKIIPLK